jgi:magnesium transporter
MRSVNPLYYVTFTTATLCASFILFQGFHTADAINTISLLCGFLVIFSGVYLLNLSREDPDGGRLGGSADRNAISLGGFEDAAPTDGIGIISTRRSMQARRSIEALNGIHSGRHSRRVSSGSVGSAVGTDREGLIRGYERGYDLEAANGAAAVQSPRSFSGRNSFGLEELAEDSDEGSSEGKHKISFEDEQGNRRHVSQNRENGSATRLSGSGHPRVKREHQRMGSSGGKGGGGRAG